MYKLCQLLELLQSHRQCNKYCQPKLLLTKPNTIKYGIPRPIRHYVKNVALWTPNNVILKTVLLIIDCVEQYTLIISSPTVGFSRF